MAGKTPEKETGAKTGTKSMPEIAAGGSTSEKMRKGDEYLCEICALSLHVDECGEFLKSKGPVCCGHPMKKKTGTSK